MKTIEFLKDLHSRQKRVARVFKKKTVKTAKWSMAMNLSQMMGSARKRSSRRNRLKRSLSVI